MRLYAGSPAWHRDANFGIQVVGRILRVHLLLQRGSGTPPELNYGYVFLVNREAQEALPGAATTINKLQDHMANLMPETVITFTVDSSFVQVVKKGQTAAIFPPHDPVQPAPELTPDGKYAEPASLWQGQNTVPLLQQTPALLPKLAKSELSHGAQEEPTALVHAFKLDAEEQYD